MPTPPFTLSAPLHSHIWSKPGWADYYHAPLSLLPAQPLRDFTRARLTINADWRARHDHGGLLLLISDPKTATDYGGLKSHENDASSTTMKNSARWLKVGLEMLQTDELAITVAGREHFADWSVYPLDHADEAPKGTATVEVRREVDTGGASLFVYYLALDGDGAVKKRHLVREVTWFFKDERRDADVLDSEEDESEDEEIECMRGEGRVERKTKKARDDTGLRIRVGAFACRPAYGEATRGEELEVRFFGLHVD